MICIVQVCTGQRIASMCNERHRACYGTPQSTQTQTHYATVRASCAAGAAAAAGEQEESLASTYRPKTVTAEVLVRDHPTCTRRKASSNPFPFPAPPPPPKKPHLHFTTHYLLLLSFLSFPVRGCKSSSDPLGKGRSP